jgi:Glucosyltransferase 24/Thioredoxin-like domain/UDP-glucose:Glycoprotein Glucosyltransferase
MKLLPLQLLVPVLCLSLLVPAVEAFWSYAPTVTTEQEIAPNISELVPPIVQREIEALVKAHSWPFTQHNVACEAWTFHAGDWEWMDRFVAAVADLNDEPNDAQKVTNLVLTATLGSMNQDLLEYSLSLRANSPNCELQRGLARAHVQKNPHLAGRQVFVIQEATLLPDERARNSDSSGADAGQTQVIYANMASKEFVETYLRLKDSHQPFVVRHMGNVAFEELGGPSVVLQGYGVRLDIKNVEYKVFDDPNDKEGDDHESAFINVTELSSLTPHMLAGVNMTRLGLDDLTLQANLWKVHAGQQLRSQLLPPTWQRRQLPMQAATVIAAARDKDVLMTFEDISQDMPSTASTLVHVAIPDDIRKMAELMEEHMHVQGVSLSVNGRKIAINRPSFNVFELLQVLQEEQAALEDMKQKLGHLLNIPALKDVQSAWSMGEAIFLGEEEGGHTNHAIRIDVGRGQNQAVIYVNDVERDVQYRQWPRQVKQILYSMQYGAPPSVRRNLFTMLAVLDPIKPALHAALQLGSQLMQAQYPARIGALLVSQVDLDACAKWIAEKGITDSNEPCPVKPIINNGGNIPNMSDLDNLEATTQAIHRLFTLVSITFAGQGIASVYLEQLMDQLIKQADSNGENMKLSTLVTLHAKLLESIGAMTYKTALDKALESLGDDEDTDETSRPLYGKALRFALNKGVHPGMGFVNGRILPDPENMQEIGTVFMEEQQHLFQLIMKDEITDKAPKSVYGMLLTGDKVFPRLHPLLAGNGDSKFAYLEMKHEFKAESLLFPSSHTFSSKPEAVFVIEAAVDFDSDEGKVLALSFLKVMDSFPSFVGAGDNKAIISIAYRLIPSTNGHMSRRMCSSLLKAHDIGASGLARLLEHGFESEDTSNACAAKLPVDFTATNYITANGLFFAPDAPLVRDDIDILLEMELRRAKATSELLMSSLAMDDITYHDVVATTSKFLALKHREAQQLDREDILLDVEKVEILSGMEKNPLRFVFNMDDVDDLRIPIVAVVDPVTESAQRVAPLLRAMRDNLKLPLILVLAPRTVMDADEKISSYYRFVAEPNNFPDVAPAKAVFSHLPSNHILTLRLDIPESWSIQQTFTIQDTDNLRCDLKAGCSDEAHIKKTTEEGSLFHDSGYLTRVEYELKNLLFFGQCYDATSKSPPNGLMLTLTKGFFESFPVSAEIGADGSIDISSPDVQAVYSDTLVMKNVGYWQLRGTPGVWSLNIAPFSRGAEIFDVVEGTMTRTSGIKKSGVATNNGTKTIVMKDFIGKNELLLVDRRKGYEKATLFYEDPAEKAREGETINVFSLATGHLYERFLKIMMLSVTKRTSSKVKFWLFENFLSPSFKASAKHMAQVIGCEVEFVTYKWPEWLRGQSEKQRIIWGYKILFLDVLFPLDVKKIIYVDADQVVRGDLKELWDMDLHGAPYGYTPMCTSRETTLGFQFWNGGFWQSHLRGKPYHISALYVVDLAKFRKDLVGDVLRSTYQQLSADPNSLSNLDQDLPNYAQHQVPIFSLPQEWLWCESWCSDESKEASKTIDLCNNPLHKEPKVSMAKRIISGNLFQESWTELDAEVEIYEQEYLAEATKTQ